MSEISGRNSDQRHAGYAPTVQSEPLPAPRMQKWLVKLDDGQAVSRPSLRGAADIAREVVKTDHSCEIWHFEDGSWRLYERIEPAEEAGQ